LRLAVRIGDGHHIGGVVDDDGVVNVVVDDVVRRRRHMPGRPHPHRDRHVIRTRQDEGIGWGRWRRQVIEVDRTRRQEDDRRRRGRRKIEIRIVERQNRPLDIDHFIRRWRRHVVVDDRKSRRWLESR
jgi:hypothetical protein